MERGHQHNNWVSMYQQRRPNPFLFFIPIAQEEMEGPLADNRILIIAINISRLITSHLIQKKKETIEEQIKRVREFNRYFPKIVYFSADSHIEKIRKCALKHLRTLPYTHLRTLHSEVHMIWFLFPLKKNNYESYLYAKNISFNYRFNAQLPISPGNEKITEG
jgi:hypothetical protein